MHKGVNRMEIKASVDMNRLKIVDREMKRFLMSYKFGLEEVRTKINILNEEFKYIHDYNPIEHVKSRIKTPESIIEKLIRKDLDISLHSIKENIRDIAGIRIVCSFVTDIYKISEMLQNQQDLKVVKYQDYIKNPKANGYQSLHLVLEVPVFMSDRVEDVCVEVQIRTSGMDFWASLEHKIYYKYNNDVPQRLKDELKEAATTVAQLDEKMEKLNREIISIKDAESSHEDIKDVSINDKKFYIPNRILSIE